MIDTTTLLIDWMETQSAVTTVATGGIRSPRAIASMDRPAIVLSVNGGHASETIKKQLTVDYVVDCYGTSAKQARTLYGLVYDALTSIRNYTSSGNRIACAVEVTHGIDLIDPSMEWPLVKGFWRITFY